MSEYRDLASARSFVATCYADTGVHLLSDRLIANRARRHYRHCRTVASTIVRRNTNEISKRRRCDVWMCSNCGGIVSPWLFKCLTKDLGNWLIFPRWQGKRCRCGTPSVYNIWDALRIRPSPCLHSQWSDFVNRGQCNFRRRTWERACVRVCVCVHVITGFFFSSLFLFLRTFRISESFRSHDNFIYSIPVFFPFEVPFPTSCSSIAFASKFRGGDSFRYRRDISEKVSAIRRLVNKQNGALRRLRISRIRIFTLLIVTFMWSSHLVYSCTRKIKYSCNNYVPRGRQSRLESNLTLVIKLGP